MVAVIPLQLQRNTKARFKTENDALIHSLLGFVVAHLQRRVIVQEWCLEVIDPDPVDAALFTVELDPVEVDHCGEDGQLNVSLRQCQQKENMG